jgi:hypothetical protein
LKSSASGSTEEFTFDDKIIFIAELTNTSATKTLHARKWDTPFGKTGSAEGFDIKGDHPVMIISASRSAIDDRDWEELPPGAWIRAEKTLTCFKQAGKYEIQAKKILVEDREGSEDKVAEVSFTPESISITLT